MKRFQFLSTLFGFAGMGGVVKAASSSKKKIFVQGYTTFLHPHKDNQWDIRLSEVGQRGIVSDRVFRASVDRLPMLLEEFKEGKEMAGIGSFTPALMLALRTIIQEGELHGITEIYEI